MSKLVYETLSYKLNGILFEVHNGLGRYCNEKQYCDGLESKFKNIKISYEREKYLAPSFEGESNLRNKIDFLIENKIIIEVKAKRLLLKQDYYQTKRYLEASSIKLGILVNFRDKFLKPRRVLNSSVSE